MRQRSLSSALATAVAAGAVLAGGVVGLPAANAAVRSCSASDSAIYTPPASVGAPGSLLACRPVTLSLLNQKGNVNAVKVQYASTDARGNPVAVSGTVAVPKAAWTGGGTRPVVVFNPGTLGIGGQCAFSKQISGQYQDAYEGGSLDALLAKGIAVAATDGIGYLNGQTHPYGVGANAGHALLDIARTAVRVPGAGLAKDTKFGLWGYSEGGHASLWAAQLAATYAPDVKVVGAAAGGVPGNLTMVGNQINGTPFAGFLVDASIGLPTAYPELPFTDLLNAKGKESVARAKTQCLLGTLSGFAGAKIESFTTKGYSLDQLRRIAGPGGRTWGQVLDEQSLGVNIGKPGSGAKYTISFPTFQYRGALEEVVDTRTENATRDAYCTAGITTDWNQGYPGEHLTADWLAVDDTVQWLSDRFAGRSTSGNCWLPSL